MYIRMYVASYQQYVICDLKFIKYKSRLVTKMNTKSDHEIVSYICEVTIMCKFRSLI